MADDTKNIGPEAKKPGEAPQEKKAEPVKDTPPTPEQPAPGAPQAPVVEAAPKAQPAPTVENQPDEKVAPAPKVLDFSATKNKAPAKEETAPEKKPVKEQAAEKAKRGRPAKADKAAPAEKPKQPRDKMSQSKKAPGKEAPIPPKPEAAPKDAKAPEQEQPAAPRDATRSAEPEQIVYINLSELHPFKNHPFGVRDDSEMKGLVESVKASGVNQPALVRPREDGGYEIIAGHRRQKASELAGFANMPCIVRNMTDDEAILAMTDDNLRHREKILPTEKANSLKMQVEAIKHQGGPGLGEDAGKRSTEIVGERNGMNYKQVQRYIRLTELVPELQKMLDEKGLAFTPAVEISFIRPKHQQYIAISIEVQQSTPSLSQAQQLRKLDKEGKLNPDVIDGNDKNQADIPMQRRKCHQFADQMGWVIVHEEQEDGVSGHKVRAENRDKIQTIKELAKQGKFDILLVFMFDRIGRIADETPFVVEWFVKSGIRVWSTQEGEQRFDNHTDKLTNYIRFWQADGESEKTSIRTKTALGQLVEDGGFKGGLAPYGYDLVRSGRYNKRKHEVYELVVNEAEAAVVRIIFDKYVHEGFGAQRIATYLNKLGYRARSGKMWHHASIRGIICNLTYTGVLRSGDSRSQVLPHLQIITPELFEAAQHIRTSRANSAEQERRVPLNTRGQSLLAGNVFCGHCGSRLSLTTNGKAYPCKDDPNRIVKRVRYVCYGKTRKQTECDGQTGYTAHTLDGIIDKLVRQIFERMKAVPKSEIVSIRYKEKMDERRALLRSIRADYTKATGELEMLRAEVIKSLRGESAFSQSLLGSLIADAETKCLEVQQQLEAAQAAYDEGQAVLASLNAQYDDIISWADMYDTASIEAKKMMVNCLIKRVDVYRDYKLHIDFNIDFEQFSMGLDIVWIAA